MAGKVSIWRWAVTEDLDAVFGELIAASEAEFVRAAAGEESPPEDPAQTEARLRAMGLPPDILEQTLKGFREMLAETHPEEELDGEEFPVVALASSHMFNAPPYAALEDAQIATEVGELMRDYSAAISAVVGHEGQGIEAYLEEHDARWADQSDRLAALGFDVRSTIWTTPEAIFFLSYSQEDRASPIDIGLGRLTPANFASLLGGSN